MVYRTRINYTHAQKAEIWDRWKRGESMSSIGRAFEREYSSMFGLFSPTGGIRPLPRKRSRLALTLSEREEVLREIACQLSLRTIATQLRRSPSTINPLIRTAQLLAVESIPKLGFGKNDFSTAKTTAMEANAS